MAHIITKPLRRLITALALAALALAVALPSFAQTQLNPPLVPNIEPEEPSIILAGPVDEQAAILAALAALPDPALPPEGAILDLPEATIAALGRRVFLPMLSRPRLVSNAPGTPTPVTPTPVTPTPVTPTPAPDRESDVAVTLWAKPSIWVARGGILEYEIRLVNYGDGDASSVQVVLPHYNRRLYELKYTSLSSRAGDWVSAVSDSSFTVTFGKLRAGERRSGKVYLQVKSNLSYGELLNVRASYRVAGEERLSNWAPVLAGSGSADAPYVWVRATPDRGAAGTRHSFFSNRFLPGEPVTTWLNLPGGTVRPLTLRGTADASGSLTLTYGSTGLARGSYQIVLYGQRSGLTGVATFVVQ